MYRRKVLVAQRKYPENLKGLWEFPGGKLYSAERADVGLKREILEELRLVIEVGITLGTPVFFTIGAEKARMQLYLSTLSESSKFAESFVAQAHSDVQWWTSAELAKRAYEMVPNDQAWIEVVRGVLGEFSGAELF